MRAEQIKDRLDAHFMEEVGTAVSTPDPETWQSIVPGLGVQAMFGWSWPIAHDVPPICVPYCPEIIDEQTEHLSDEELGMYLDIIEVVCDSHIGFWFKQPDPLLRQQMIEEELLDLFPTSLRIWSDIQLRALDNSAAAK